MILNATNETLEIITTAAVSLDYCFEYADYTSTGTFSLGDSHGNINTATTTIVVPAPAASTSRKIKSAFIRNRGTTLQTVTISKDVGGTNYHLTGDINLDGGEYLTYDLNGELSVFTASGARKLSNAIVGGDITSVLIIPNFSTANLTSTKTITSTNSFAVYIGKAPRTLSSVSLRYRVTTAAATITWSEVAVAKGTVNIGGNPTLTVVGFADTSAINNSTGQKTVVVNVSSGQSISAGDDLWALIGNQATTAGVVRAASIADDIQLGIQASLVARPSLIVGVPTSFTIEGATALPAWIAAVV